MSHEPSTDTTALPSAFDTHHPPSTQIINMCVHCGFCLPVCPTYALWNEEMDSPRGRIYLMKMAAEGKAAMTPQWVQHFDTCLGCMACMTACPSGVDYGKLIEATRAQIEQNHVRSPGERLHRWLLFKLFPHPRRLRLLRPLVALYQRSGLQALMRKSVVFKALPRCLQALDTLLSPIGAQEAIPAL